MSFYNDLEQQIAIAMQADRHRLRNLLRAVRKAEDEGRQPDDRLEKLLKQVEESTRKRERRQSLVPKLIYDESLPVVARRNEIAAAIREHPVVVVSGETGSGKSTQLPKICLEIGRGVTGMIGHTQPRRIAARSIASRVAEELGTSVGQKVGFKIRFTDTTSENTLIKVMTDGVLLAESQHDRFLEQYDTLIIDEAHERSLNIDFLLGYLHRLLAKRPDLRVIITSATIDAQRFAEHFGNAPVIEVTGRTYPVDILYRPLENDESDEPADPIRGVADAVEELCWQGPGDMLVFLPTERDILDAAHKLRGRNLPGGKPDILPLYARLSTAEQNKVFQPHGGRRIVLATNVAESSLTVPGIHYVVDTGTARISRYSARSKVQRLPIERISQASADQRKGRCGRIGPGICIRLFSEDDYVSRERFTAPEIHRTNLAAVILQLAALDLGPIDEFPFLDPPRAEAIRDGYKTLFELNAIDENRKLLPLGRQLAQLPVDPRIGRMLVEADREHCLADVLIIAAALEVQDPRNRPADQQQQADAAHAQWADPDSDFVGWLRLWDFVQNLKEKTSRGQFRKACQQNFLSDVRLREWHDVHRQLVEMAGQFGLKAGRRKLAGTKPGSGVNEQNCPVQDEAYAAIHRSLLAGLLSSVANRGDTNEYTAAGGGKFQLWPGSGVYGGKPRWIVAGEMVETTRRYLRTVARIDPDWIEPLASHLVNRSHSEPHWDRRAEGAMAYEKVSLFGLTVVPRRRVRYSGIDPVESRRLLVEHGLVERDFDSRAEFFKHNRKLLEDIAARATKTRRRELIVEPHVLYRFYDERVPTSVVDGPSLDRWLKSASPGDRQRLFLTEADALGGEEPAPTKDEFPDQLQIDKLKLPLAYRFEPGDERDGLTVTVPREAISQLTEERLGWLIPGLIEEKIQALIKTLPKSVRREFGPAPDIAKKLAAEISFAGAPFLSTVAAALSRSAGARITPEMFDLPRLPPHLRINIRVVDQTGNPVAEGRDLAAIRSQLGDQPESAVVSADSKWHRDGITKWDFGPLPASLDVRVGGLTLTKYPALVDSGESAALRLVDSTSEAERMTRLGVLRLFEVSERRELKTQVRWLPSLAQMTLFAAPLCKQRPLEEQLIDLLAARAFYTTETVPRDADEFEAQRLIGRRHIVPAAQEVGKLAPQLFEAYHEARLTLDRSPPVAWQYAIDDIRQQLDQLLPPNFLVTTPWTWLLHLPRYLKGITYRLSRLQTGGLARDQEAYKQLAPRWQSLQERRQAAFVQPKEAEQLAALRWMLEELRISLFAQVLGTSMAVSPQRFDKQWSQLQG